jgi:hypothetical protein
VSKPSEPTPAVLVWEPYDGTPGTVDDLGCDLSGHFWARAVRLPTGEWSYTIWDYQNNQMLTGVAPTLARAQGAVATWDRDVVASGTDPSRTWAGDDT